MFTRDKWRPGFLGGKKSRVWPKKLGFLKISDFFCIIFLWNNIVKLDIDHAVSEEIAATDDQLLLK